MDSQHTDSKGRTWKGDPEAIAALKKALTPREASPLKAELEEITKKHCCPGFAILHLTHKFNSPTISRLAGLRPSDDDEDYDGPFWVASLAANYLRLSRGEQCIVLFLINVWSPDGDPCGLGKFDLIDAASVLDTNAIDIITQWAKDPWWP